MQASITSSIDGEPLVIRPATHEDSGAIAEMANLLNEQHGKQGNLYDAALVEREAFGPDPLCRFVIAEFKDNIAGYALHHEMFNSDLARRGVWLVDLFVHPAYRRNGIGQRLLAAVARQTIDLGFQSLWWGVTSDNVAARSFYEQLGARDEDARILELDGAALIDFADQVNK